MTLGPCHTLRHEASWIVPHRPTGKNFRSIFSVVNPGAVSPPSTILAGEMQDRRCRTEMQDGDAGQEMQDRRCRTDETTPNGTGDAGQTGDARQTK
jgi:hypothetical protein